MRPLKPEFKAEAGLMDSLIGRIELAEHEQAEQHKLREKIRRAGYEFKELKPEPGRTRLLTVDTSISVRQLRYHALWAGHSVAVHALYDGCGHEDPLVGHGLLPYTDILYSSYVDAGEFKPYSDIDVRCNLQRVGFEFGSLMEARRELDSDGVEPDFTLVDGSLYTNLRNLEGKGGDYTECAHAVDSFRWVLDSGRVVGMVEDSHATDLSRELGYNFTNMLLFDIALEAGEYVVNERTGVSICYIKMPSKGIPYLPEGMSTPLTVRWEFNYPGFRDDLNLLAGIWLTEDDLLHPQLYPVRTADYLTRRISTSGILDNIASERELELRHREGREV
jgi:hypothetical protein